MKTSWWARPTTMIMVNNITCVCGLGMVFNDMIAMRQVRVFHIFVLVYILLSTWQIYCHYMARIARDRPALGDIVESKFPLPSNPAALCVCGRSSNTHIGISCYMEHEAKLREAWRAENERN